MKKNKFIFLFIGFILIIIIVYKINLMKESSRNFFNENMPIDSTINNEYLNIFSKNSSQKFSNYLSYPSKFRNVLTDIDYDSLYSLVIYKIDLSGEYSLSSLIKEEKGDVKATTGLFYRTVDEPFFKIYFRTDKIKKVSNIFLTFDESSTSVIIKNDSIAYYYLSSDNFSLKYGVDSAVDFGIEPYHNSVLLWQNLPKGLLFIRRNDSLFLALMSVKNKKTVLPTSLLYDLLDA